MNYYKLVAPDGFVVGDGIGMCFSIGQLIRFVGNIGRSWKVVAIITEIDTHSPYNTHSTVRVEEILA